MSVACWLESTQKGIAGHMWPPRLQVGHPWMKQCMFVMIKGPSTRSGISSWNMDNLWGFRLFSLTSQKCKSAYPSVSTYAGMKRGLICHGFMIGVDRRSCVVMPHWFLLCTNKVRWERRGFIFQLAESFVRQVGLIAVLSVYVPEHLQVQLA